MLNKDQFEAVKDGKFINIMKRKLKNIFFKIYFNIFIMYTIVRILHIITLLMEVCVFQTSPCAGIVQGRGSK